MRVCTKCGVEKDISNFAKNGKRFRTICKKCETKRVMDRIKITVAYVQSLKHSCEICGYNKNKEAMDFHHRENEIKLFSVGSFASSRIWSKKTKQLIDEEVAKCRCLCANCHREIHSNYNPEIEKYRFDI